MQEARLIDANALKAKLKIATNTATYCDYCNGYYDARQVDLDAIDSASTIEAEPVRHGRWIPTEYDGYANGAPVWDKWECSECGHEHSGEEDTLTAFCPNCGARMDGGADNATD